MDRLRIWAIGTGEICYAGLYNALCKLREISDIKQLASDDAADLLKTASTQDICILSGCKLNNDLIPLCMRIHAVSPRSPILVCSVGRHLDSERLLSAGASAHVRSCAAEELTQAIRALTLGYQYFDLHSSESVSPKIHDSYLPTLTHRQKQICRLVSLGLSDKEIADNLCISPCTVRSHLRIVFERSGVRRRAELAIRESTNI